MGVKRLPKGASATRRIGKLMVKQGGFGFAESGMVPFPRAPLRTEAAEQSPPQRDGHLVRPSFGDGG